MPPCVQQSAFDTLSRHKVVPDLPPTNTMSADNRPSSADVPPFGLNPFANLNLSNLSPDSVGPAATPRPTAVPSKNRGRVDIQRQKAGRGGKIVTVVSGFVGIGLPEKEQLAKQMQKACGAGGTVKDGKIEIQGDNREMVARILTAAGFRPVRAGG